MPVPAKKVLSPPRLAGTAHIVQVQLDACVHNVALFLGITVGPNEAYRRISDAIYSSMGQVSKERLAEDREAARQAQG